MVIIDEDGAPWLDLGNEGWYRNVYYKWWRDRGLSYKANSWGKSTGRNAMPMSLMIISLGTTYCVDIEALGAV